MTTFAPICTAIETALDLLSSGLFAGIKDSSGDYEYFARLLTLRDQKPLSLLVGSDRIFKRARQAGADGIISGVACAVPELLVALVGYGAHRWSRRGTAHGCEGGSLRPSLASRLRPGSLRARQSGQT